MKAFGRMLFYLPIINEMTVCMKRFAHNNFNSPPIGKSSTTHRIDTIIERLDDKTDNSRIKLVVDISPEFPTHRISNSIHHVDYLGAGNLFGLVFVIIMKETSDNNSLDVGQSVLADINVLGTLQITADIRRTTDNRYHIVGLSWHHNWLGLVKRASHA